MPYNFFVQMFEILRIVLDPATIKKAEKFETSRMKSFYADILIDIGGAANFNFKEIKLPSGNHSIKQILKHYAQLSSKQRENLLQFETKRKQLMIRDPATHPLNLISLLVGKKIIEPLHGRNTLTETFNTPFS